MVSRHAAIALLTLIAAVGGACTYGHEDPQSSTFRPLVFPGEARLGASLFMVIDSNQISIGDDLERYDLTRDRVKIEIEGNLDSVTVQPRSVFTVEAGRATVEAEARANTWLTVAFFDLPDASQSQGAFAAPYPLHALLHLLIDNQPVPELEGIVWVIGEGGKPTSIADGTPLQLLLEDELEPQTMVRLRARGQDAEGFDPAWSIAGITAEIQYDPSCLTNPRAHWRNGDSGPLVSGATGVVRPGSGADRLDPSEGIRAPERGPHRSHPVGIRADPRHRLRPGPRLLGRPRPVLLGAWAPGPG